MSKMVVGKEFTFDAAHHLPGYDGPCAKVHGHTYKLIVEVSGPPAKFKSEPYDGIICDFSDLKRVVENEIIRWYDHSNMNDLLAHPTAENIVNRISRTLLLFFKDTLERVRLYETPTSYAEWRKE